MTKIHIETDQEYLGRKLDIQKRAIARWIIEECDDPVAEVEWMLDIAYPEGSYERFQDVYDEVLNFLEEDNND